MKLLAIPFIIPIVFLTGVAIIINAGGKAVIGGYS